MANPHGPAEATTPFRSIDDPSARLQCAFQAIADTRMRDIPILNPRLSVEALGFCRWQHYWIGILITPWFMNILCLPGDDRDWEPLASGTTCTLELPSGSYGFLAASEAQLGPYLSCSLFSPVLQFTDMAQAREVATAALDALLKTPDSPAEAALAPEGAARRGLFQRLTGAR
jgi:[NiFe] hydrogenase assembly HybE family chaperone